MAEQSDLEKLYREAQSALKAKDYPRASDLLRQILKADVDYKDAAQLLARVITLSRRRWYNDPRTWGALGALLLVGLGIFYLFPKLQGLYSQPVPTPVILPTNTPSPTIAPPAPATATATLLPIPIPLTWKRISLGQEFSLDEITTIVQDSKDKDLLYIQTRRAGVYNSFNGGVSWQPATESMPAAGNSPRNLELRLPGECAMLAIHPQNFNTAYCGIEKGIFRTSDAGKNWELSSPHVGWIKTITISPHNPQVIFAGGQGFSVSIDGGETWKQSNNGLPIVPLELKIYPKTSTTLFAQELAVSTAEYTNSGFPIYRSIDSGRTWAQTITNNCALMFDADGNTICGFKKSLDGGKTWSNGSSLIFKFQSAIGSNYPYSPIILATTHGDPKIHISQDKGRTWQYASGIETDPWNKSIRFFFDPNQGQVIYAFDVMDRATSVAYRSDDFGITWQTCPSSKALTSQSSTLVAIDYDDNNHLLLASQGNGILVSTDGCTSWQESNTGLGNLYINTVVIDPNKPETVYAGADDGAYISFDSGNTWNKINDGLLGATVVYSIAVDKDSNVYAATPYGIFKLEGK